MTTTQTTTQLANVVQYTLPDGRHVFGTVDAMATLSSLVDAALSTPSSGITPTVEELERAGFVFNGMGRISGDLASFNRLFAAVQFKEIES
jgi:hypothetical protein